MSRTKSRRGKPGRGRDGRGGARGGGGKENTWRPQSQRQAYQDFPKENEQFQRYYNHLDIVSDPQEREEFWAALRRELPNSFRFCGSKGHAIAVQKNLVERYIPQITSVKYNDEFVRAPEPMPWYPAGLAWQMTTPKQIVRKFPPFAAFQKFLVSETQVGNISRQEAVSMIPPLLLDVKPGHSVLDLCAAPGSKSAQLIEMIHAGEEVRTRKVLQRVKPDGAATPLAVNPADEADASEDDYADDGRATGLLVANDVNYQRAQMLVHQVKRLNSPNLVVMNHDATLFPSIELPIDPESNGQSKSKWLKFDRILADVPCSGDGTLRKNPNIWKDWIPGNGLGLYITQVRILVRSLQMLKVGGRVVYSTCSLNPIENEAVIASAVERCGGLEKVEIVDCTDKLPELKRKHGLTKWSVMDKGGSIWNSWEEVENAKATKFDANIERIVPGMFAPGNLPLERCIRVYPHQQDTGGFFITVLEKKSEIRAKPESKKKTAAPSTAPSAIDIAKEIESKPEDDEMTGELDTLNEFLGVKSEELPMDGGNTSAAQRQNKETVEVANGVSLKREADEGDSDAARVKRARVEPADVGAEVIGEPGQTEHWPPPPTNVAAYPDIGEQASSTPQAGAQANGNGKRRNTPHEESFKYLDPNHPEIDDIFKFYELPENFPRDRFMVRNERGDPVKAIYYTTTLAKSILTKNEGKGMKFVHSGVKMFVKQDAQGADTCRWRIQTEGLPIIEGWVGESRIIRVHKRATLQFLLREMFPKTSVAQLAEIKDTIADMAMGCSVMRVEPSGHADGFSERMTLPFWRSVASVNLMLPKEDRKAMLLRLFDDDTALVDHSQQQKIKRELEKEEEESLADSEDGGVKLDAGSVAGDGREIGTEDEVIAKEDRLEAERQVAADEERAVAAAPDRAGEDDAMNKTV